MSLAAWPAACGANSASASSRVAETCRLTTSAGEAADSRSARSEQRARTIGGRLEVETFSRRPSNAVPIASRPARRALSAASSRARSADTGSRAALAARMPRSTSRSTPTRSPIARCAKAAEHAACARGAGSPSRSAMSSASVALATAAPRSRWPTAMRDEAVATAILVAVVCAGSSIDARSAAASAYLPRQNRQRTSASRARSSRAGVSLDRLAASAACSTPSASSSRARSIHARPVRSPRRAPRRPAPLVSRSLLHRRGPFARPADVRVSTAIQPKRSRRRTRASNRAGGPAPQSHLAAGGQRAREVPHQAAGWRSPDAAAAPRARAERPTKGAPRSACPLEPRHCHPRTLAIVLPLVLPRRSHQAET